MRSNIIFLIIAGIFGIIYFIFEYMIERKRYQYRESFYRNLGVQNVRPDYEKRMRKFYKKNKPRTELENDNIKLKLYVKENAVYFYCVNKQVQMGNLRRFISEKNIDIPKDEILRNWAFFDLEFNKDTTIQNLIDLQTKFHLRSKIVIRNKCIPIIRNFEIHFLLHEGKPYIFCKKRYSKTDKNKKENFIVRGDIAVLYDIYYTVLEIYSELKNYEDLLALLSKRNDCTIEQKEYSSKVKPKKNQNNLVDINSATESEFATLPRVNVILAKRIVLHREMINGFKNKEEFYEFCKFKPHFIEQLDNLITVGEFDIIEVIMREDERIIDTIDNYDDTEYENNDFDSGNDRTVDL